MVLLESATEHGSSSSSSISDNLSVLSAGGLLLLRGLHHHLPPFLEAITFCHSTPPLWPRSPHSHLPHAGLQQWGQEKITTINFPNPLLSPLFLQEEAAKAFCFLLKHLRTPLPNKLMLLAVVESHHVSKFFRWRGTNHRGRFFFALLLTSCRVIDDRGKGRRWRKGGRRGGYRVCVWAGVLMEDGRWFSNIFPLSVAQERFAKAFFKNCVLLPGV